MGGGGGGGASKAMRGVLAPDRAPAIQVIGCKVILMPGGACEPCGLEGSPVKASR